MFSPLTRKSDRTPFPGLSWSKMREGNPLNDIKILVVPSRPKLSAIFDPLTRAKTLGPRMALGTRLKTFVQQSPPSGYVVYLCRRLLTPSPHSHTVTVSQSPTVGRGSPPFFLPDLPCLFLLRQSYYAFFTQLVCRRCNFAAFPIKLRPTVQWRFKGIHGMHLWFMNIYR